LIWKIAISSIARRVLTHGAMRRVRVRGGREGIILRLVSNFGGEGVSNYTLQQMQKYNVSTFGRERLLDYTLLRLQKRMVSNFGGEEMHSQQFWKGGGIGLHSSTFAKTHSQQF